MLAYCRFNSKKPLHQHSIVSSLIFSKVGNKPPVVPNCSQECLYLFSLLGGGAILYVFFFTVPLRLYQTQVPCFLHLNCTWLWVNSKISSLQRIYSNPSHFHHTSVFLLVSYETRALLFYRCGTSVDDIHAENYSYFLVPLCVTMSPKHRSMCFAACVTSSCTLRTRKYL